MKGHDVAIIGLGPAGATLGYLLAKRGMRVLGIDYKKFPREKLCAGLITYKTQSLINNLVPGSLDFLEKEKIIFFSDWNYGIGTKKQGIFWQGKLEEPFKIVERQRYDYFWYKKFLEAGGKILTARVVGIREDKLFLDNGETLQAKFIIGADGVNSVVRKYLAKKKATLPPHNKKQALALEAFLPRDMVNLPYFPCIFFGYVPDGYVWSFPSSKGVCIGLGAGKIKDGKKLKVILEEFCWRYAKVKPAKVYAHFLPYGDFEEKPGLTNCFLIGDAAGFADPLLGEGIFYAHKSAYLLFKALERFFSNPAKVRKTYFQLLKEELKELRFALYWRKVTFSFLARGDFYLFKKIFSRYSRVLEETIQGKRSFYFCKYKDV